MASPTGTFTQLCIPGMEELNIGHTIISRAALVGLERAVREMKREESLSFGYYDEDANLLLRSGKSTLSARRRTTRGSPSERTRHYHEKEKRN